MGFQHDLLKSVTERLKNIQCVYSDHTRAPHSWKKIKRKRRV